MSDATPVSAPLSPDEAAKAKGGLRYDEGKERVDLMCPIAAMGTARVWGKGARKYAAWNWAKGMPWSKVLGSLLRHVFKFMKGEDWDADPNCPDCQKGTVGTDTWFCVKHTGELHVDCIGCNANILQRYARCNKDLDDRFKSH